MSNLLENKLQYYKNKNIHIVGIGGAEGSAIGEFLVGNGISSITGHDFSAEADFWKAYNNTHLSLKPKEREEALKHLLNLPIKINFKDHYLEGIENADMVFVSQVWFKYPQNMPILSELKDSGVPFKTITNLYFELALCKIISVTGTNGKTTTAKLINSIFEEFTRWFHSPFRAVEPKCKFTKRLHSPEAGTMEPAVNPAIGNVYFAGNDRQNIQVLDKLSEMKKDDVLILETSSTQLLLNSGISPHIGVITNITPNHIDDHGSFENYIEAKKNLIRYQKRGDWAVLNYDDAESRKIAEEFKNNVFLFSRKEEMEEGCFVRDNDIVINCKCKFAKRLYSPEAGTMEPAAPMESAAVTICNIDDIKIPGRHNLENVLAAVSAAYLYGISPEIIREGVSKYAGIKHRLKLLYDINGVKYYDDTQATTPEAAIAGIDSFEGDIILLAGGDNKGMKYEKMAEKINDKIKLLILFPGDASDEIEKFINKKKVDFVKVKNFRQAIEILKKYLKNKKTPSIQSDARCPNVVLISPGAAHFYSKFVESANGTLRDWIKEL